METTELGNEIFKVTAVEYFKEALFAQEFEKCKELIGIARKLGVEKSTIDDVIVSFVKGDAYENPNGTFNNRLHIFKED